jgi:hypothetical protein
MYFKQLETILLKLNENNQLLVDRHWDSLKLPGS